VRVERSPTIQHISAPFHNEKAATKILLPKYQQEDRLCVPVVRDPGCRPRGSGVDSGRNNIFRVAVGLERGSFKLVRINEELLERKSNGSGIEN
jgi:hypothetical protein